MWLRQRWERRPDGPTVYAVQTEVGPDRVSEKLDGVAGVERVGEAVGDCVAVGAGGG